MRHLLFGALLIGAAWAADGEIVQTLRADLNNDGKPDSIVLKRLGEQARLVVLDSQGRTLWEAPRTELFMFGGPLDGGDLQAAGDLDGDKSIDLVGTYQKGDVSPTRFRWFRWTGSELKLVSQGYLCPLNQRPGTFKLSENQGAPYWVERVLRIEPGRMEVELYDSVTDERNQKVWLRSDRDGEFVITQGR